MHDEYDYESDCIRDISFVRLILDVAAVMTAAAGLIVAIVLGGLIFVGVL
ncbi:hypothetical protein [Bradyrhizobium sp. SZCCHNRI1073]|nr:hypothetical protein [Bradyrhizobium sp. SZCCHNRI1073]